MASYQKTSTPLLLVYLLLLAPTPQARKLIHLGKEKVPSKADSKQGVLPPPPPPSSSHGASENDTKETARSVPSPGLEDREEPRGSAREVDYWGGGARVRRRLHRLGRNTGSCKEVGSGCRPSLRQVDRTIAGAPILAPG
ncbi:hypothetical protein BHE74_00057384 [Ensete ventricosum]|nr:hypothetical protein BHE74_00057384 [Ensete ventricosum]RZS27729.1 hypothetical protein BHM03_00061252 [Ensete ventricosum]